MNFFEEISYYRCPDNLFDLSSTLYRVADRIPTSMKLDVLLDLQKIVDAYDEEPTMSSILRNIKRFMEEELIPCLSFSELEEYYMRNFEDESCSDELNDNAKEDVDVIFRKNAPLRFNKLSTILESILDDNASAESTTCDELTLSFVEDIIDDQSHSTMEETKHPDDPKDSSCHASASPIVVFDPSPSKVTEKESLKTRLTNLGWRVVRSLRR